MHNTTSSGSVKGLLHYTQVGNHHHKRSNAINQGLSVLTLLIGSTLEEHGDFVETARWKLYTPKIEPQQQGDRSPEDLTRVARELGVRKI